MDRRNFLLCTAAGSFIPLLAGQYSNPVYASLLKILPDDPDEIICLEKFNLAAKMNLASKPVNEVMIEIGRSFLGTEYVGHVLEQPGEEKLVVNMRALDCVSFYENCLVLSRCIKMKKTTFADYKAQLQLIRYRGGIINGYPSRLHYTTDYWYDNEKKGILAVMTKDYFGAENVAQITKLINFMTKHRDSYKQLANDEYFNLIQKQEDEINARDVYYLPKERVQDMENKIPTGSLLGITTTVEGMDIAHTGVAIRLETGRLHFMHAPNVGHKVQITEVPLHEYLAGIGKQTGIIVAKVLEPV